MKSFLMSATLLLSGAAMGDTSIEMNSGKPGLVSFEEAQRLLGEVPSITFEDDKGKRAMVRIPDVKLAEVCLHEGTPPVMEQVFEFHALRLTHRERPDVLVTVNLCPFQKGMLRATLFSFDGAKYRPTWVLDTGYDYDGPYDIRDLDGDGFEELLFVSNNSSVFSYAPRLLWGHKGKVLNMEFDGIPALHKEGKKHWFLFEKRKLEGEDVLRCFRWEGPKKGPVKFKCPAQPKPE